MNGRPRLTAEQIKQVSALAARQAEERTALACRQSNEIGELEERHLAERKALGIGGPTAAPADASHTVLEPGTTNGAKVRRASR